MAELHETDVVRIRKPVTAKMSRHEDKLYPAGSEGAIIVIGSGDADVEFPGAPSPDGMIYEWYEASLPLEDLELVKSYYKG